MSQLIHHVWGKFILILVGHDKRSFSLQTNITKDIRSIVQWVNDFSMISFFLCITIAYCILIALQYLF